MLGHDNRSGLTSRLEGGCRARWKRRFEQKGTKVTKRRPEVEGVTRSV